MGTDWLEIAKGFGIASPVIGVLFLLLRRADSRIEKLEKDLEEVQEKRLEEVKKASADYAQSFRDRSIADQSTAAVLLKAIEKVGMPS